MTFEDAETNGDTHHAALFAPGTILIRVRSLKGDPNYCKCPRCWHYHTDLDNYDKLCERCCCVLLEAWPDEECTKQLRASGKTYTPVERTVA